MPAPSIVIAGAVSRGRVALGAVLLAAAALAGCGKKAPPLPPEPRGPHLPVSVGVRQIGTYPNVVFQLPQPRGSKPAQELFRVELIRVIYASESPPPADADAFRRRGELVRVEHADPFTPGAVLGLSDASIEELKGRGTGATLRYAVRVLDRRGRPSAWVAAADLVLLPTANPPSGLVAEPTADGVRLTWEGTSEHGYNVYRSSATDEAPVLLNGPPVRATEYLDETVGMGRRYTYRVRGLLADGRPRRETADSKSASVDAVDRFPPARPRGLVAVQEGPAIRLFWDPSPERDIAGYRLSRSVDEGPFVSIGDDPLERPLYLDQEVRAGQRLRYRVTALDGADPPNESPPAETKPLTLIEEPGSR